MTRRAVSAFALLVVLALFAAACSSSAQVVAEREVSSPVPTVVQDVQDEAVFEPTVAPAPVPTATVSAAPTAEPTPTLVPTPVPTPQPEGPCEAGPLALPNPDRPKYQGLISVNPELGRVEGFVEVSFTPDLDVDEVYVRLWPNGPRTASAGVVMTMDGVMTPSGPIEPEFLDPTTVRLPLAETLTAGSTFTGVISFDVRIPVELRSRISGRDDYMRLGTILPLLPWEPGTGWALDPATSLFAEAVSSPVADYTITVVVPEGYTVLASGIEDASGTWHVEAARDFALSVGRFRTVTGTAMAPEPVQITVGAHETIDDDIDAYLAKIIGSVEQFSQRWGQYPWPSLTFALTPNLSGGIEFPTHIMQGPNTLGRVTSHEVGHMFFYSLVGNNQGSAPWLDEGITSYAEFTYEGTAAGAFGIPAGGVGNATQPMTFWEERSDIYYRSVYAQTGFALQRLGSQEDVDCALARYVAANAHQIATADDFIAAFEPTFPNIVEDLAALGVDLGQ